MATTSEKPTEPAVNFYPLTELLLKNPQPHPAAPIFPKPPNFEQIRDDILRTGIRDSLTVVSSNGNFLVCDGIMRLFDIAIPYHKKNPSWNPRVPVQEWTAQQLKAAGITEEALIVGEKGRNFLRRQLTKGQRAVAAATLYVDLVYEGKDDQLLAKVLNLAPEEPAHFAMTDKQLSDKRRDTIAALFALSGATIQPVITVMKRARDAKARSFYHLLLEVLSLDFFPPYKLAKYTKLELNRKIVDHLYRALEVARKKPKLDVAATSFCNEFDRVLAGASSPSAPQPTAVQLGGNRGPVPQDLAPAWVEGRNVLGVVKACVEKVGDQLKNHPYASELRDAATNFQTLVQRRTPADLCRMCWKKDPEKGTWTRVCTKGCSLCGDDGYVAISPQSQSQNGPNKSSQLDQQSDQKEMPKKKAS